MYSWILAQFCYNAVFVKDVTISHRSDVTTRCFRGIPSESSLPMDPESLHERILCWLKVATPYRGRMMSLDRAHMFLPLEMRDLIHGRRVVADGRCQKEKCAHE